MMRKTKVLSLAFIRRGIAAVALFAALAGRTDPRTLYVAPTGDDAQTDVGTAWEKAYRNIQSAVDAAVAGDTVLVTNGTYYAFSNEQTCVVTVTNGIRILSVEGPSKTIIDGIAFKDGVPDPSKTLTYRRLVHIKSTAKSAVFCGFTCTNGMNNYKATGASWGLLAEGGFVSNVVVHLKYSWQAVAVCCNNALISGIKVLQPTGVSSESGGFVTIGCGGVVDRLELRGITRPDGGYAMVGLGLDNYGSATLRNSVIADCVFGTTTGSGTQPISLGSKRGQMMIQNCTFVNNEHKGSVPFINCGMSLSEGCWSNMRFHNNIMTDYTTASLPSSGMRWLSANFKSTMTNKFLNCCCSELPSVGDNISADPVLDSDFMPDAKSKCVNSGMNLAWVTNGVDFAGRTRLLFDTVDIGAVECTNDPSKAEFACGAEIKGSVSGRMSLTTSLSGYTVGDATGLSVLWVFSDGTRSDAWPTVEKTFSAPGRYSCTLYATNGAGKTSLYPMADAFTVLPNKCYVRSDNGEGTYPWDSREKGTSDLEAVLALKPYEIQVADGEYRLPYPTMTMDYALRVYSENGPEKTTLRAASSSSTSSYTAMSSADALLAGFTLTGGRATSKGGSSMFYNSAGTVSNCVVRGFSDMAAYKGTGCYIRGTARVVDTLFDFADSRMTWQSDGANTAVEISGQALVDRCVFTNGEITTAASSGAAIVRLSGSAELRNSLVVRCRNYAAASCTYPAAAVKATGGSIENCTIVTNVCATKAAGLWTDGTAAVTNTIIAFNQAAAGEPQDFYRAAETVSVSHSLSPDVPEGSGNIVGVPVFRKGYVPAFVSPGIRAGHWEPWMATETDLAGKPRATKSRKVDIGAYQGNAYGLLVTVY